MKWLTDAQNLAATSLSVIAVGNKLDLKEDREVTFLEASRFALENNMMFMETSALTGEGIEEVFLKCTKAIINKIDQGQIDPHKMASGIQHGGLSQPWSQTVRSQTDSCC
eukprot:c4052_g1_i2.p1 GENE.c4052_g1_i2~~c4052_g1_i2.p1  ORF type:complete len:110 (+),score=17.03 c4052_g1_i2:297-626(+)